MGRIVSCFRPGPATDYYGSYKVERSEIVPPKCDVDNEDLAARLLSDAAKLGIKPSLASTFSGATVFLTGGTGYVGSVMIEQLLRGVPDLGGIYMLVRPKHGAEPEARLDRLLARPIFDSLRVEEADAADAEVAEEGAEAEAATDPPSPPPSSAASDSDVDSANNAGGQRPEAFPVGAAKSSSTTAASSTIKITDGVLQFKAPRRPLLPHLRAKLHVLSGDVCKPRCGLSDADAEVVATKCDFIVHCAASISFFEHVHVLLEQNYVATRNVLDLAAEAMMTPPPTENKEAAATGSPSTFSAKASSSSKPRLRGMVHVSTAYVNANLKRGTHVEERIYPLVRETTDKKTGKKVQTALSHADVVAELLALPAAAATKAADKLVAEFGYPNAYTLSKHLAEDAVADAVEGKLAMFSQKKEEENAAAAAAAAASTAATTKRLRAAIVRPTIIGACAGGPAPGYFGNAAGPTQLMLAYASEMATFLCHNPNHVWDIAPCDIVGSVIMGAAAALDVARRVEEVEEAEEEKEERGRGEGNETTLLAPSSSSALLSPPSHQRLLVFHAASSMSNTIRYGDLFTRWVIPFWDANMPPRRFRASKKYKSIHSWSSFVPEGSLAYAWMRLVGDLKFGSLAALLRVAGQKQPAEALWRGWKYLCLYNDERLDFGLFFCVRNVEAVEAALAEPLAPGTPGAKAYERAARRSRSAGARRCVGCSTAASAAAAAGSHNAGAAAAAASSRRVLIPAGSMTATGDAIVGAVAAAVAAAAAAAAASTTTFLPAPLTWRGDWGPYMLRYSEVIYAKFFGPDGALNGAGMKRGKERRNKGKKNASASVSAASVSASSTTTPRRVRAVARMALVNRGRQVSEAAAAEAAAAAAAAAAVPPPRPTAIYSAPATPARPSLVSSSPPSTPPNEPVSPCSVFLVAPSGTGKQSRPTVGVLHSSTASSPVTLLRRLTPQRFPKLALSGGIGGGGGATAQKDAAPSISNSNSTSSSSSLAEPATAIARNDSVKDLSEYTAAVVAAAVAEV